MTNLPSQPYRPDDDDDAVSAMPFLDHLEELRWRLLKSIIAIIVGAAACFYFADQIFLFLVKPLGDVQLHFTEVTGSFYAYLKVAFFAGLGLAAPVVFYQLWSFIAPGLYSHEKQVVMPLVIVSTLLFLLGAAFCYYGVLPIALQFLIGFSEGLLNPIITVGSYISFAGLLLVAFGLGFELPVAAYFLARIGLINAGMLARGRRYALVTILIAGAIITPPDVFTQLLLAGPVYLLYEISIIIVRVTRARIERRENDESLS